jgi:hypothetical protein
VTRGNDSGRKAPSALATDSLEQALSADAFLREAGDADAAGLEALSASLGELPPEAAGRARLLSGAVLADRFARFAQGVAELLDVSVDKAKQILELVDKPETFSQELPNVSFCWVEGGPSVQDAVRGFVRVQAGTEFPQHEHFGPERVLILQGSYVDSVTGEVFRPGDIATMSAGSSHGFQVPAGGPDLLKLAVVTNGLRAGDKRYEPR